MIPTWTCYIIYKNNNTYCGITNNVIRRLKQHNSIIKGGAKATTSKGPGWQYLCHITGFQNKIQVLQFEWAVKHVLPNEGYGLVMRIKRLFHVLNSYKWTSKAPIASTIPLTVHWFYYFDTSHYSLPDYISQK